MTMTATQREFTVRGRSFTTDLTDAECYDRIIEIGKKDGFTGGTLEFARSLARQYKTYQNWSERQQPHAHNLVVEYDRKNAPKDTTSFLIGFLNIVTHMLACRDRRDNGGKGLLNPCITVKLNDTTFSLKLAGPKSKRPNHISVAESRKFGAGEFYGWITPEGNYDRYSKAGDDVLALLERVAIDPSTVISQLGRESGLCCYCAAGLTQTQSKIAGCGKTCSGNWDVWYPNAAETRSYLQDNPQVLEGSTDADRWIG